MTTELLTPDTVLAYLISKRIISPDETAEVEVLTGGVSNIVLAISTKHKKMVLKQALAELLVAQKWEADQRRAIVEAHAIELFHKLSPDQVPDLLFLDSERFILILERVPLGSSVWKTDLLNGQIDPNVASVLGTTLAKWHNFGEENENARTQFMEDSLFEQLRVSPFYRAVAAKNSNLQEVINSLIDEITTEKIALVHGDFSPKNILATPDHSPIVLDFEVAHTGNPVFDLGFICAHLLCKTIRTDNSAEKEALIATATNFLNSYRQSCNLAIADSLPQHVALIALARVEGVSPVNYLDESAQRQLVAITKSALLDSTMTFEQLFENAK